MPVLAWIGFVLASIAVRVIAFKRLHRFVRRWPVSPLRWRPSAETIRNAVDTASRFALVPVQCLERALVAACLFRLFGHKAEFVIGVRRTPFYAHAWVELDGEVMTDTRERIAELAVVERC